MTGRNPADSTQGSPASAGAAWPAASVLAYRSIAVAATVAVVEGALVTLASLAGMSVPFALLAHVLIVTALGFDAYRIERSGRDPTVAALQTISIAVLGPVGAVLSAVFLLGVDRRPAPSPTLDAWYERISLTLRHDAVQELADDVSIGRSVDAATPFPRSYSEVFGSGTLKEQQTALGLIARKFHPNYLPPLRVALASREPVIRAQAAAVAARVRAEMGANIRDIDRRSLGPAPDALSPAEAAHIKACAASGLMDEGDRVLALSLLARLEVAEEPLSVPLDPVSRYRQLRDELRVRRSETWPARHARLIEHRRFAELRLEHRLLKLARSRYLALRRRPDKAHRSPGGATR